MKKIYIVHCVDTEGPLYEPLSETFIRLKNTFELKINPTKMNLENLQKGIGINKEIKKAVMDFISPDRLNYNSTWSEVDELLDEILSEKWRNKYLDDFGNGYIFNWFILDHVGFNINPRRRTMGYHAIFEHYLEKLDEYNCKKDEINWHFHPVSFTREAHKCSNNYSFTNEHIQILSRRVIDHNWFPTAFRPGQHTERPDINLFLEQWIPFDYGNQAISKEKQEIQSKQKDLVNGRFGDWRRATTEWEVYNPDYFDYQKKGNMKRYIARCLNLNSRLNPIDEEEIISAFERADNNKETIMAITNHDEREMRPYIDEFYQLVRKVQKSFKEVKIQNAGAVEAMVAVLKLKKEKPLKIETNLKDNYLDVRTDKPCWGPQPYFCFRTKSNDYIHENLDYHGGNHWGFTFDENTICLETLDTIGLATNDKCGNVTLEKIVL